MNFEFFESMTCAEAEALLDEFLRIGSIELKVLVEEMSIDGLRPDFSLESIQPFFEWVLNRINTLPKESDPSIPEWIRQTDTYKRGLFSFDESSQRIIFTSAYYLGETFQRSFEGLKWSIGEEETAQQRMPVVTGFNHRMELAPILVAQNLLRRILADGAPNSDIQRAVDYWSRIAPVPSS